MAKRNNNGCLLTNSDARVTAKQHTKPCSDCPFARKSVQGWLGGGSPESWASLAHSDLKSECHVLLPHECAGMAIFRANVCKSPRDPTILKLPRDTIRVFANNQEFMAHHYKEEV